MYRGGLGSAYFCLDTRFRTYILVGMLAMKGRAKPRLPRDPQRTRSRLLQAAFREVYKSGFRGTDLETILAAARVTKGALYHYFESKEALGYALVDEVILEITREKWIRPLQAGGNPIDVLVGIFQSRSTEPDELHCGCPLNNLAQEMSPLDEGFRKRLAKVFDEWHDGMASALRDGQNRRLVRRDINPDETATFLIAGFEGCLSLGKTVQDVRVLRSAKASMTRYLESLRTCGRAGERNAA